MTIPSISLDETKPAGTRGIKLGDNDIREHKKQVREIVDVDHKYDSSGQDADMGKHDQVSLLEKADLGTGAVGTTILGSQTVSGKGELVYTDEDDNDVQLTDNGTILPSTLGVTLADWAAVFALIYPVGSEYTNHAVATNPATLLGFGTWTALEGTVTVGKEASGTFDTLGATVGTETHTLTTDEMPAHTHTDAMYNANGWSSGTNVQASDASNAAGSLTTSSTGGGTAHTSIQPSLVAYKWKRTA